MQRIVEECMSRYGLSRDAQTRYIDLVSEVGELGKEILKAIDYGNKSFPAGGHEDEVNAKMEMGDCLFSLFALCCGMGIDAREALEAALAKYEERFSAGGKIGSEITDGIPNQEGLI